MRPRQASLYSSPEERCYLPPGLRGGSGQVAEVPGSVPGAGTLVGEYKQVGWIPAVVLITRFRCVTRPEVILGTGFGTKSPTGSSSLSLGDGLPMESRDPTVK